MKRILSAAFSLFMVLSALPITANAADASKNIHQEIIKVSHSDYENFNPDKEIEIDGKKYSLVETKIISDNKETFEVVTENLKSNDFTAPKEMDNPHNSNQRGKLIETTFFENHSDIRKQTVTKNASYTAVPINYAIPEVLKTTYMDDETNQSVEVSLKLSESNKSDTYWKDINNLAGSVTGYDALYYNLENSNIQIPKNEKQPNYKGYENEILKSLGLNNSDYKITGSAWMDDTFYNAENVLCRNCIYNAQAKVCDITAVYSELVELPDIVTYTATSVYEDLENSQYTIELDYEKVSSDINVPMVIGGAVLGILVLAALIAAILMHLSKKKKSEEQANVE